MPPQPLSSSPDGSSWPMSFSQSDEVIHRSDCSSVASSYSHRGHDQCDTHLAAFFLSFSALHFLSYSSNRLSLSNRWFGVNECCACCSLRDGVSLPFAYSCKADSYCHAHDPPHG